MEARSSKIEDGSAVPRLEAKGTTTANNSATLEEIKVCNATECACTARKGYTCSHQGPCKQIVGNNTEQPRCPDCGSIALKFATRDYCEGDYYWCHACGCGPIRFPLEMCLSTEARQAAAAAIQRLVPVLEGNKAICMGTCMCQPDNNCGRGACGKLIETPDIISADDLQAELEKTPFADTEPFDAAQFVNDIVGS